MPYHVVKHGTKFVVEKKDGSKSFGTHDSKEGADAQMAALYANEPKAMRSLHLVGATSVARIEQYDGREHLVVPVVALIGDNVIHAVNAPAAEYVPASVISHQGWDGRPLMLGHPVKEGKQISANDPRVMERQGFGFMAATRMNGKRLGTEAWCDVAKLEKLGQVKLLEDLRAGKPIEVSVGAYVQTRERAGSANGKAYKHEWATIAPDHLAFLPESTGACSVEMGCGANRHAMRVCAGDVLEALRDIPQSERDEMDASDFAGPDESFPIKTQADVDAAKRLIGKAKDPDAVKARIKAIATRKGLTIPDAWQTRGAQMNQKLKKLLAPLLKALDGDEAVEDDDPDEAAESISYEAMRALVEQAKVSLDEGSKHVDALIAQNGTGDSEEVEDAHLEALVAMCVQLYGTTNGVIKMATACLAPEGATSPMAYMEGARALIGREISAKNKKTIQSAHDALHESHDALTAMGADCPGEMKAASQFAVSGIAIEDGDNKIEAAAGGVTFRAACGCKETDMKRTESVQTILTAASKAAGKTLADYQKTDGFSEEQVKGLNMVPERILDHLATLASKSPADAIIQAKHNADAAVAAHGHALNMQDEADKAKKAAADKKKVTLEEYQEQEWLKTAPPSIRAMAEENRAVKKARKAMLVKALDGGKLTAKQLEAKPLEELETLAAYAGVEAEEKVDYSGRAMPRAAEGDVYSNPPNGYDIAIEKMRKAATH